MRRTSRWVTFAVAASVFGWASLERRISAQEESPFGTPGHSCEIQAQVTREGGSWGVHLEAVTNLPEGTHLLISLLYGGQVIPESWSRVFVNGPRFARDLGLFSLRPFSGEYEVRVSCDLSRQDPGPYLALQDEGDLEFRAALYLGTKEEQVTQDRAFAAWLTTLETTLQERRVQNQDIFKKAAAKTEFQTKDGAFDAFACTRWMDQWVATVKNLGAGVEPFRQNVFAPKYPALLEAGAEAVTAVLQEGCVRAMKCFQSNGVPPPPKFSVGGGILIESDELAPMHEIETLRAAAADLNTQIRALEKEIHDAKERGN